MTEPSPSDWRHSLGGVLDAAWREIRDRRTPRAGTPGLAALATIDPDGFPQMRMAVLVAADKDLGVVHIHTDSLSRKVSELAANASTGVMIWQPETRLQIRMTGPAQVETGDEADKIWQTIRESNKRNYGVTPPPGTAISSADAFERIPASDKLGIIKITIDRMDVVHLGRPDDIRAEYRRDDGWRGQWLAP